MREDPESTPAIGAPGRFVWPPKRPTEPAPPPPLPRRRATREQRSEAHPPSLLEAIEREWLDVTSEPVARLIARGVWAPDPPQTYCHRCGRSVGPHEADESGCGRCRGTRPPWAQFLRLGEHDGALRRMISEVKFARFRRRGLELGALLGAAVADEIRRAGAELAQRVTIVPVPTTTRRRLVRGIDHTRVIAAGVGGVLSGRVEPALRRRHVPSQLTVAPSRRAANVAGTIRLKPGRAKRLAGGFVLVIDDVCTTGATMRGSCRAVREGVRGAGLEPPLIWAGVVARAIDPP